MHERYQNRPTRHFVGHLASIAEEFEGPHNATCGEEDATCGQEVATCGRAAREAMCGQEGAMRGCKEPHSTRGGAELSATCGKSTWETHVEEGHLRQ